jgi:hypothetical protein
MKNLIKSISAIALVAFSLLSLNSCEKEKSTTIKITVRDANNALVIGAGVNLFVDPLSITNTESTIDSKISQYKTTDYKGEATFDVTTIYKSGSAGVGILDILVESGSSETQTVIKIEPEVENTQIVYVP